MTHLRRISLLGIPAGVVAVLLVVTLGRPATGADPNAGFFAFSDPSNQTTFAANIEPTSPDAGRFQFTQAGVGLVWPATRASVLLQSDHSVIVRYDAQGEVDAQATLDQTFGFHIASGTSTTHAIRLEAQVNPDRNRGPGIQRRARRVRHGGRETVVAHVGARVAKTYAVNVTLLWENDAWKVVTLALAS
jgi:hypothetical protein